MLRVGLLSLVLTLTLALVGCRVLGTDLPCTARDHCGDGDECIGGICTPGGDVAGEGEGEGGEGGEGEGGEGEGGEGEGEGEGEGGEGEGEGEGIADIVFRLDTVDVNDCENASHESGAGDDHGGIAWAGDRVVVNQDDAAISIALDDLEGDQTVMGTVIDGIFSDLADGSLWTLADQDGEVHDEFEDTVEAIALLDPVTGLVTATSVPLSQIISGLNSGRSRVGIFSGVGEAAVVVDKSVHIIDLATGVVTRTNIAVPLGSSIACETFGVWGLLERTADDRALVYAGRGGTLLRTQLADGDTEVAAELGDAGDLCSFTVDPVGRRLLMHTELDSIFNGLLEENIASCAASICFGGACNCAPNASLCSDGCRVLGADESNCAACGTTCEPDETCGAGGCGCATDQCGSVCVDLDTDEDNCLGCGDGCLGDELCLGGCVAAPDFRSTGLEISGCSAFVIGSVTSNLEGFAVIEGSLLASGTGGIASLALPDFTNAFQTGGARNYVTSDLATGEGFLFTCSGAPCEEIAETELEGVSTLDAQGTVGDDVELSQVADDTLFTVVFAGAGRVAMLTLRGLLIIEPRTGFVELRPAPLLVVPPSLCENERGYGVIERVANDDFLVFIEAGGADVVRVRLSDNQRSVLAELPANREASCALSYAPAQNVWVYAADQPTGLVGNGSGAIEAVVCPAAFDCDTCL